MNRFAFAPAVGIVVAALTATGFAQATKTTPPPGAPAPASPAAWVRPIKGLATIEVIQAPSRRVGKDMVTTLRIKNTSSGAIALLKSEEFWYDKSRRVVSGDSPAPIRRPIAPGEIVEITFKAPAQGDLYQSSYRFSHAHGDIKATSVKKFSK